MGIPPLEFALSTNGGFSPLLLISLAFSLGAVFNFSKIRILLKLNVYYIFTVLQILSVEYM